jgi:hypothetical protein
MFVLPACFGSLWDAALAASQTLGRRPIMLMANECDERG